MKRKCNAAACLLLALALFLTGAGLWQISGTPDLLEYIMIAPQAEGEIARLVGRREEALEDMAGAVSASTVTAAANGVYVSSADAGTGVQASVLAGSEGFFEVLPEYLVSGRLPSETELREGAPKAVLDEDLAFALFPTVDPIGRCVLIDGIELEIVGVVRHTRRVGERELYGVCAPLLALTQLRFETLSLVVKPLPASGASIMFETVASDQWQSGGSYYSYEKEVLRAQLPLLYTAVIFAFALIVRLVRLLGRQSLHAVGDIRARLEQDYLPKLLPRILLVSIALLLGYAALGFAAWQVGSWAVEPLYVFPEWVPEDLVKWSAIRNVFWNLAVDAAQPVRVAPSAVRALQFWAGVIRWGTLFGLTGLVLLGFGRRGKNKE